MAPLPLEQLHPDALVELRVVLVDDDSLVREVARSVLSAVPGLDVVGVAADPDELEARILQTSPDVVVLDIRMPPTYRMEGIEAAHRIRAENPGLGVVILSQHADPEYALEFLRDGSAGRAYLLKERLGDPALLVEAIREVAAGGSVLDPKLVDSLLETQRRRIHSRFQGLTKREQGVVGLMASGRDNTAIARGLLVSEEVVEKEIDAIFHALGLSEQLGVDQRVTAVLFFLARGVD
jgi:DNA-binding NarL/FixJ family response regulator